MDATCSNGLIDVTEKLKILKQFDNVGRVLSKTAVSFIAENDSTELNAIKFSTFEGLINS